MSALTGPSARSRTWLEWVVRHTGAVVVPALVLVETVTGDPRRDAEMNWVLHVLSSKGRTSGVDEPLARLAGTLRYRAGTDDGIDALVAAEAAHTTQPCVVLTSDPDDLNTLLADHPHVTIRPV